MSLDKFKFKINRVEYVYKPGANFTALQIQLLLHLEN